MGSPTTKRRSIPSGVPSSQAPEPDAELSAALGTAPVVYADVSGSFANTDASPAIQNRNAGDASVVYADVEPQTPGHGGARSAPSEPALPPGQVGRAPMPLPPPSTGPAMSPPSTGLPGRPPMPVPTDDARPAAAQQPGAAPKSASPSAAPAGPTVSDAAPTDTPAVSPPPAPEPSPPAGSAVCVTIALDDDVLYVEQRKWDGIDAPCHGFRIVNKSAATTYSVLISIAKSENMGWLIGDESVTTTVGPGATVDLDEVIVISPELGSWALAAEFEWRTSDPDDPDPADAAACTPHRSILKTTSEGASSLETELANRAMLEAAAEKSLDEATSGTLDDTEVLMLKRNPTAPRHKSAARSLKEAAAKGKACLKIAAVSAFAAGAQTRHAVAKEASAGPPALPDRGDAAESDAYDTDGLPLCDAYDTDGLPRPSLRNFSTASASEADAAGEEPSSLPRNISVPRGKEKGKRSMKDIKAQRKKAAKKAPSRLDTDEEDAAHRDDTVFQLPSTRKTNPLFVKQPSLRRDSETDW